VTRSTAFLLFLVSLGLQAAITIDSAGPVNAASYIPEGLLNSGVARGAIFIVKGTELCANGYTKVERFPLPFNLDGTTVTVSSGGSVMNVYMIYRYGGLKDADGNTFDQIAALMPSLTNPGTGTLSVTYNGKTAVAPITIRNSAPGIFTLNQAGHGPGVITDNNLFQANTVTNSFHDRMWANLWVTGMGPLGVGQRDDIEPPIGNPNLTFELLVGGRPLDRSRIAYWGRAPGFPGLDQIAFQPPPGVTGCSIPVAIKFADFISNTVTMSLGPNLRCSDPLGPTAADMDRMERGQTINTARVALVRVDLKVQTKDSSGVNRSTEGTVDVGYGRFSRYDPAYARFSQEIVGLPTAGNCIVQSAVTRNPATFDEVLNLTADPVPHTALNAGSNLNLSGGAGTRQIAAPGTPTSPAPPSVAITFVNSSSEAAHIFVDRFESFGPNNRLDPGASRQVTVVYVKGLRVDFVGGRNGTVIGRGSITMAENIWTAQVAFDDSATLKITTAAAGGAIAMFNSSVTSGYYKLLGAELRNVQFDPEAGINAPFLNGGNVNLQTAGVAGGVGPINKTIPVPTGNRIDWPGKNNPTTIVRSQGYTVHWTGGDPATDIAVIYGHSPGMTTVGSPTTPGASFVCTAGIGDGQFTIPAATLLQIPTSKQPMTGIFSVGTAPLSNAGNFTAEGLESGKFTFSQTVVRSVTYQ
jgi:uncharacterized protein (TIGR03437 family)